MILETLKEIMENIIKNKAGVVPVFIYDEIGVFKEVVKSLNKDIDIFVLENNSKIAMQNYLYRCSNGNNEKYCAIYSNFNIDVDGLIGAKKLNRLDITPTILLKYYDKTKDKLEGDLDLTLEQYILLADNFDIVLKDIINNQLITKKILKISLSKVFVGKSHTPKDMMISFINGSFNVNEAKSLYLYEEIRINIREIYNIDIIEFEDNKDLLEKILVTLFMEENKHGAYVEFNDKLIKVRKETLNKVFNFIKENSDCFKKELDELDKKFKDKTLNDITYVIPQLFKNYIVNNIENYNDIDINYSQLWTEDMRTIGNFVDKLSYLDILLKKYISYTFHTNTMESVIREYKESLWKIDNTYREVISLLEDLSYNLPLYARVKDGEIIEKLSDMYFNVIGNINSKYISNYSYLLEENAHVLRQDNILKKLKFRENTVFIFADGLRYELAKTLLTDIECKGIIDYDVLSLIPTETEICMNGYFITDEKIRINNKNTFELIRDGKLITQITSWRIKKLSDILNCHVVLFEEFKSSYEYEGGVILFYDDVDITTHKYNSAKKVTDAVKELKTIIEYSISRNFDVMLLSDHGFLDIESKIEIQNTELDTERKKGRYLILPAGEVVDTMYYKNYIPVADFIEKEDKNISFINSINSLRKTTKYTHGGISLQENIITAILFKAEDLKNSEKKEKYLSKLEAFNEIRAEIVNAKGFECSVYAGTKMIFMVVIDSHKYLLRIPIRNYKKGDEFLITIIGENHIEKHIVTKAGNTLIDKELDIF